MERQLSNVSYHSYQDQPARRYGPQYEPGGYAAAVQQRTNMTQREDALKFEQGRIKALQEERLHIQKKTFTKWINSFLQKARMEVEDLFVDLGDGRRLLKLLEIISGERLPRPNQGRMRVHKIENVNKSLSFLHTKVRLESIGAEDIVDGNPRLILGLVWTIILRFQIQEIEIDVDEENVSSEKKSAKDALLLWCQRKTAGYQGVTISNFSDSWRSGLGFNALIHSHRPDLFRWSDVPVSEPVETLNHAFDVAHKNLGIPKLLDAEDVDTHRPDEKSVMTYVASYYHTFARMKNEQKSGRRIANIIGQLMDCDGRKAEYGRLISTLLAWIRAKIAELDARDLPNQLDAIQRLLLAFKQYRTVEKPPKYKERSEIEALYFDINTMNKSLVGEAWSPLEGQLPHDLERAWQQLEQAEHAREIALRTELLRQQRLEQLNYKFNTKSVLRKGYLKEMIQVLSDPRYGSNLAQVDATVKKHEAISADIIARTERFEDLSAMAAELVREGYHGAEAVTRTERAVLDRWNELLLLLEGHRVSLARLAHLMSLLREADAVGNTLDEMKTSFQSEEVGRHLVDVERLAQAHALQELQLQALHETIRRLVRQGKTAVDDEENAPAPRKQLQEQLAALEDHYDSLVAAAKDRKARLEDARNLYQFLEDHDEEEGWVSEKQRICLADVAAKDLRGVLALRQKHTALLHELRAREHVSQRHRAKGQRLIEAGHPKSAEIERRLSALSAAWDALRQLADQREKHLSDAQEAHQFYGDANESESWMKEKRPLVATEDCGRDAPQAAALLQRHKALNDEIRAYSQELEGLKTVADRLLESGITTLQLPTEVEAGAAEDEEWVNESRLVPTEVWEDEPVERLEHRTVTEERQVPQVKALYPFTGQGISMAKGEVMFLINKTNPDWWSVRKADRSDGFVPANYVREVEPRVVPVQVRRPEKVRTVQRVKKTVLVKQVVPVKRTRGRRAKVAPLAPAQAVKDRMDGIQADYEELLTLSAARREQLEDAIKLCSFFAECDDFDKWLKDKEKMLRTDEPEDSVDQAKRKYEKFVTDLSAASKRLEHVEAAAEELAKSGHGQAAKAASRRHQLKQAWDRLLRLKAQKEKSLEGASSVELFSRTCDEALDWMAEKQEQLSASSAPALDLRTVRALQRRHAQLERELEPLKEKVTTVTHLADSVKSQYPSEKANVESRQREISKVWSRCLEAAEARRSRLESAVGHQIFGSSARQLADWLQKVQSQLQSDSTANDVATAESLLKEHGELRADISAHQDEFKEVIGLGKQLVGNNPVLEDVKESIKQLEEQQKAVEDAWAAKDAHLKQVVQLASFNREADHLDAASGAHDACLQQAYTGSSVDEVLALLKRHEELEARLCAQDERLSAFSARALLLAQHSPDHAQHITSRRTAVLQRRSTVKQSAAARRRALQAALALHQFLEACDELHRWISDKTRTANDQSYRDLGNLERKLQKHEAFERELQANEKQLRNVEGIGQSLQKSDPAHSKEVSSKLEQLQSAWADLVAASRDKGGKLRQADAQKKHRRSVEDARARLAELEQAMSSQELGTDLRSCRKLLTQHQALEQELSQWEQKATSLSAAGADLVSGGHFDAGAIESASSALLEAVKKLQPRANERRKALERSLVVHKFAAAVSDELQWVRERAAAPLPAAGGALLPAQAAAHKHDKLRKELEGRAPAVERVLAHGAQLLQVEHPQKEKIKSLCADLKSEYLAVCSEAESRAARLEAALKGAQFVHEAAEVEAWLADKAAALADSDLGGDRHRATRLLTRHKAVELELDTYAAIISEMGHVAASMSAGGHPAGAALVARHGALADCLARLKARAAHRQQALVDSVCRHEYLAESAELESWIQEQLAAASSEDYGTDYEHLLILQSKFDDLRHRVESGAERFTQCEELAKKLLVNASPHIEDIERRQEALGESWQKLVDQIGARAARLHAAGEIHRYHRDVAELLARVHDKRASLVERERAREVAAAARAVRAHDAAETDLLALDAQLQVLVEEGTRLQSQYPGGNVAGIARTQRLLDEAWRALRRTADERRAHLTDQLRDHHFRANVRELTSWSVSLRTAISRAVSVRDALAAQAARADHDAARADIDARDDSFRRVLEEGQGLIAEGHPNSQEIEEKCKQLVEERQRLVGAWATRQVALDQLIDLHCFLRDARQLHALSAAQEAHLSTEIPPTSSVEEVEGALKRHEAFNKLLETQEERVATLRAHADKLLQQGHVESKRIKEELDSVEGRRRKLYATAAQREEQLQRLRARAQFARDAAETRAWAADKLAAITQDQGTHGEVTSLEDKIKKLQKHQAFTAELAAHRARLQQVAELADQLVPDQEVEKTMREVQGEWARLEDATRQRGRGLEEAQDILEFNQQLDKIEAWIRDKELMVQAHDLGRDYEHCSALLRRLDGLDSDMQVDDKRVRGICALADKLLQQGPTQQATGVATRRDAFLAKWRALSGHLKAYRERLAAAQKVHAFNRDVEDTSERIAQKKALFSSTSGGRELALAHELKRRHVARASEAGAVRDKIRALEGEGRQLADSHPERAEEIQKSLQGLREGWEQLQQLAEARTKQLDDAIAEHEFDERVKELEVWVSESVKRMGSAEPETVEDAQDLLTLHDERKAEIDGRQKVIAGLLQEADGQPERVGRVEKLASALDNAWTQRKQYLAQALQLQQLKEQARQVEDWLAAKEAFLNNEDLGENLDAVETLIRKHAEFSRLLESQLSRVNELKQSCDHLDTNHYAAGYIAARVTDIVTRTDKLKESCAVRANMLEQSKQLHELLRDMNHEREWIAHKMQAASLEDYRELSNLQSKVQQHEAFESELGANKARVDLVASHAEDLIEKKHYASKEIAMHVEELENQWRELQAASVARRQRLAEAAGGRVLLRALDDFCTWLADVEGQLLSEDHGKDLSSVNALLKRHTRLEQQVAGKAEVAASLSSAARQLATDHHFMRDEILEKADHAVSRYKQLSEPIQLRRANLEDAAMLLRWERDADEEINWMREREGSARSTDFGSTLAEAQALLKKHVALEAEIIAREPAVSAVVAKSQQLSRRGHFAGSTLEGRGRDLAAQRTALIGAQEARGKALRHRVELLQLLQEISEAEAWLSSRRPALASADVGRDEDSVRALQRRLDAAQRELAAWDAANRLANAALALERTTTDESERERVRARVDALRAAHEEVTLLCARRQQRLQQSAKYFKFAEECSEVQEWISEQVSVAASEDYGLDVEHVETLQQAFDNFLQQLHANEGRIEAVCEAGNALLEENTPEAERVRQRVDDVRGLWEDLKELALARQEALAGARQVHEFDRSAEETALWVSQKEAGVGDGAPPRSLHALRAARRRLDAHLADLHAVRAQHDKLRKESDRLGAAFPDAKEHVSAKLEDVTEALQVLTEKVASSSQQLELAGQLQHYFQTYQELLAWTNETLARVTAPDLSGDVAGAERLLARHRDLRVEITAKNDAFNALYADGEKLIKEGHFMSDEISERMSALRSRRRALTDAWEARDTIYIQHHDALVFKRDCDVLDNWIAARVPLVRDGNVGSSVAQVEELLSRHQDLEGAIALQQDRFNALRRITLVEAAFKKQKEAEAAERAKQAERAEAERAAQHRRRQVEKLHEERRKDGPAPPARPELTTQQSTERLTGAASEETLSPAPQFERLPKPDHNVKRAESMSVMKTPKRTPSFTTRRRTQSFRRHQRPEDLPPVEIQGFVERKQESGAGGSRATVRSWRGYHCVLCGQLVCFFRDERDFAAARAAAPPLAILNARCTVADDYRKRAHVFRLTCADGAEYLFACPSNEVMQEWVAKLSFHAQLPPSLQLTPYSEVAGDEGGKESPTAELRRRLHENASSSSSENGSPVAARRSQAEILRAHRASLNQANNNTADRNIESSVLPSLPARPPPEDAQRQGSQGSLAGSQTLPSSGPDAAWGRSRFSNGRDINQEFIRSQQEAAEAPPLTSRGPPNQTDGAGRHHGPERGTQGTERGVQGTERGPQVTERGHQVTDRSLQGPERGHQGADRGQDSHNNNWHVETSHFYSASEIAYGGGTRPASVAGGSPALDQRPASRSSGESELSVTGREKKDKKGVFGGLFSRKKRPQSHM